MKRHNEVSDLFCSLNIDTRRFSRLYFTEPLKYWLLAGKKKDKWAKIFRAENQITLDNKKRVINCQSGDEKKALIGNSKNSGTQAMFNFKTGKGKKNKFIGVVVK